MTGGPDGQRMAASGARCSRARSSPCSRGSSGVDIVVDVRLFGVNPITGEHGQATQRLDVEPHAIVFSCDHQILVEAP